MVSEEHLHTSLRIVISLWSKCLLIREEYKECETVHIYLKLFLNFSQVHAAVGQPAGHRPRQPATPSSAVSSEALFGSYIVGSVVCPRDVGSKFKMHCLELWRLFVVKKSEWGGSYIEFIRVRVIFLSEKMCNIEHQSGISVYAKFLLWIYLAIKFWYIPLMMKLMSLYYLIAQPPGSALHRRPGKRHNSRITTIPVLISSTWPRCPDVAHAGWTPYTRVHTGTLKIWVIVS